MQHVKFLKLYVFKRDFTSLRSRRKRGRGRGESLTKSEKIWVRGWKKKEINVENEEAKGKVAAILNTENIQGKLTGVP